MYKFQKPQKGDRHPMTTESTTTTTPKDVQEVDFDEVDRAQSSLFDPNSTSTSIWEYEYGDDDEAENISPGDYSSLPVQVAQLNNLDSVYFANTGAEHLHHYWEAEDVGDFITTLDESTSSDIPHCVEEIYGQKGGVGGGKNRPKSMYNPCTEIMVTSAGPVEKWAKMTTSCYGTLSAEDINRIGSEGNLNEVPLEDDADDLGTLAQLEDTSRRLWMASTEELIQLNQNISKMIQQRVTVDVHHQGCMQQKNLDISVTSTTTDDNLVSLENSYCEPQINQELVNIAEIAESGEWHFDILIINLVAL